VDDWPSVRVASAESLGGRPDSAEALLRAMDDPSFAVVAAAVSALAPVYGAAGLALCHDTPRGARVAVAEWFADPEACAHAWTPAEMSVVSSTSSQRAQAAADRPGLCGLASGCGIRHAGFLCA
jgi:hypothetical protein